MRMWRWALCAVAVSSTAAWAQSSVVLRREQAAPEGTPQRVTSQGVVYVAGEAREQLVRWDQIARVEGALSEAASPYVSRAELAWRARTRLERGDLLGAEPFFDSIDLEADAARGPLAAMVASGQLRCRLHRMAQASSVRAWLAWLASDAPEHVFQFGASAGDHPYRVVDEEYLLAPTLPPLWMRSPSLQLIANTTVDAAKSSQREMIAQLYVLSARGALAQDHGVGMPAQPPEAWPGALLVWDVLACQYGTPEEQTAALARLRQRIADSGERDWIEAWCRVALGRALVRSMDGETQRRGVVQLLQVPARFGDDAPYLAGFAMTEVVRWLEGQGRHEEALRVWSYAAARYAAAIDLGSAPTVPAQATTSTGAAAEPSP